MSYIVRSKNGLRILLIGLARVNLNSRISTHSSRAKLHIEHSFEKASRISGCKTCSQVYSGSRMMVTASALQRNSSRNGARTSSPVSNSWRVDQHLHSPGYIVPSMGKWISWRDAPRPRDLITTKLKRSFGGSANMTSLSALWFSSHVGGGQVSEGVIRIWFGSPDVVCLVSLSLSYCLYTLFSTRLN